MSGFVSTETRSRNVVGIIDRTTTFGITPGANVAQAINWARHSLIGTNLLPGLLVCSAQANNLTKQWSACQGETAGTRLRAADELQGVPGRACRWRTGQAGQRHADPAGVRRLWSRCPRDRSGCVRRGDHATACAEFAPAADETAPQQRCRHDVGAHPRIAATPRHDPPTVKTTANKGRS